MRATSLRTLTGNLVLLLALSATAQSKPAGPKAATTPPAAHAEEALSPLDAQQRAIQMLNRFTFGPRPGEIDAVEKMGPDAWFEQQRNPQTIPDPAVDKRLADFPSLYLAPSDLLVQFPS